MLFPWMFAHRTLIADYWLKREQHVRSSRPRCLTMIAAAWVAHVSIHLFSRMILSKQSATFFKSRSTNHMFRQAIAVLKCNCASFIVLGVQRAASDGPAAREMGFGPIIKRETVIVLVNASAAVPAGAKGV